MCKTLIGANPARMQVYDRTYVALSIERERRIWHTFVYISPFDLISRIHKSKENFVESELEIGKHL